jgi:transcriptional regulator with GAF, ATPase, and Fis domain
MSDNNELSRLQATLRELKTINSLNDRISRVRETNHIMSIIINELIRITDSDQGVINLVSADIREDMQTVIRKSEKSESEIPYKVDKMVSGWVLKNKQMLKIDDLDRDDRFNGLTSENGRFKSILCFPMLSGGEIIGLTSLVRNQRCGPFNDDQCRLAGIIISQSAQVLKNAMLFEELAQKSELLEISYGRLKEENLVLKSELNSSLVFENIIGKSKAMREILALASRVSANDSPVLITGPTGTGKELISKAIHYNSHRKDRPLIIKNCGVKTETLLESELFGHVKGAFTGADKDKPGLFKQADGGTIFLDEIGDAPSSTQMAILRAIETGEIRPVGSSKGEIVDVRVISATNKDLKEEIEKGNFRQDLFYRLNTFTIKMPPLANRKEDIPLLTRHFINKISVKQGIEELAITPAALERLINFSWPGNVRQLENEIERAAVVCEDGKTIDVSDLSSEILSPEIDKNHYMQSGGRLRDAVESLEKDIITSTLKENDNNIQKSSRILGLTRKGLKDKMRRYGIGPEKE